MVCTLGLRILWHVSLCNVSLLVHGRSEELLGSLLRDPLLHLRGLDKKSGAQPNTTSIAFLLQGVTFPVLSFHMWSGVGSIIKGGADQTRNVHRSCFLFDEG